MGYVFISYSSKDRDYADTIKRELEKNGINTWMAPGDIPAGTTYAGVITKALKEMDSLVLLLTNHSQESKWVDKEVERAINYEKIIIPIALENVTLNDNFEYYLGNQQIVQVRQLSDNNTELAKIIMQLKALTGVKDQLKAHTTQEATVKYVIDEKKQEEQIDSGDSASAELDDHGADFEEAIKSDRKAVVNFGRYPYNNANDVRPIRWKVLTVQDNRALIISEAGLTTRKYNEKRETVTWKKCSLRKWLNSEFLNKAFTADEQKKIILNYVTEDKNPYCKISKEDTRDKIFLLSIKEVNEYFKSNTEKILEPTPLAKSEGAYTNDAGKCHWWTRSTGIYCQDAAGVDGYGRIGFFDAGGGSVDRDNVVVRPALWIQI